MSSEKKYLFFFTTAFPCSKFVEAYIENEIPYLAGKFNKVFIFPVDFDKKSKPIPENTFVINIHKYFNAGPSKFFLNFFFILKIFFSEFFRVTFKLKSLYNCFSNLLSINYSIEYGKGIERFMIENNLTKNEIYFYSYWLYQPALALAILKSKGKINHFISRGHQADVYDNPKSTFQQTKIKYASKVFLISAHAKSYLQKKYPDYLNKFELNYLGALDSGLNRLSESDGFTIVTCSKFATHKRIFLIPRILQYLDFRAKWVHFGIGGDKDNEQVYHSIKGLPPHIQVELKGFTDNRKILEFYKNNPVNLFINVSTIEGLSVAMIEALSFGIPLIGTDINGTKEIVTKETGFLIPIDFDCRQVAGIINDFRKSDQQKMRKAARLHYEKHFNAEINNKKFCQSAFNY